MWRKLLTSAVFLVALARMAEAKIEIRVDLDRQRMTVTKTGEKPIVWKVSSGRAGFETPTGSFIVQRMDADHFSDEYDQAPMPFAIFFYRGLAIHGSYQRGLGRPASHGCVRLSVDHARELYGWVEQSGGASIEITGKGSSLAQWREEEEPHPRKPAPSPAARAPSGPFLDGLDAFFRVR